MAWRAAQNGLKQANGFLREAVAGEQVDVRERLGNEFLGLLVQPKISRSSLRRLLLSDFRAKTTYIGA